MPIPASDCDTCTAGCTTLYEVVGSVVSVAYEAVACQLEPSLCEGFTGFVSHAEPYHPEGDYVAGWISGITARDGNQNTPAGLVFPLMVAEISIKLMETGYPTVEGDGFPTYQEMTNAALHSYSHMESMARAIFANVGKGGPNRILRDCGWQGMSRWTPVRPSGGLIGWTFSVSLSVPT